MALHKDHNRFLVIDFAFPICQRTHSDKSEPVDVLDLNQMICLNKSHLSFVAVNCLTTFERTNLKLR